MSQETRIYVGRHDGVCAVVSADGGHTWRQEPVTPLTHAAARLCASAANPQRAFLAAYEAGVYRTDDGGAAWRHLGAYPGNYAHSVLAHPEEPDTVYVGSEPAAVFRSKDGGQTWEELEGFRAVPEAAAWNFHSPTRASHVRDLRMSPADPQQLYAGIEVGGIVGTRDGGSSWRQLPGLNDDIHCIGLSRNQPNRVYAATAQAPYRSDDGGSHWELINAGLEQSYTLHIASSPEDADLVLVTVSENARRKSPRFYRSTDGGRGWTLVNGLGQGEEAADMVVAFEWDSRQPNNVYAGVEGGELFRSQDRGFTWEQLPITLSPVAVGALAVAGG